MKKLLFKGPILTCSGYGVHSRQILKALIKSKTYDISVESLKWGNTSILHDDDEFLNEVRKLCLKHTKESKYDISVQVTIPNEFVKCADFNIGITAGIEVDIVSPEWIKKANEVVDSLIVPSQHSKDVFENSVYKDQNGNELRLNKPAIVAHEGFDPEFYNTIPSELDSKFPAEFNFLFVGLGISDRVGEERKNTSNLIRWFCETFKDRKDVGLVLKTGLVNNSLLDFEHTKLKIEALKKSVDCGKFPQIHLVHGRLTDGEMSELYKDKNVKCFISLTHGEGFGLPLLEAAACGLPVMATNWSGHLDFLTIPGEKSFIELDFDKTQVPESSVWNGVIEKGTSWASVKEDDVKTKMRKVVASYSKPKEWAGKLAKHVEINFSEKVVMSRLVTGVKQLTSANVVTSPKTPEDLVTSVKNSFLPDDEGKKLLYTMPMSAGDVYISTAVVDSLKKKYPDHKIFFATKPQYKSILKGNPNIHKVIDWQEWMMNIPLLEQMFDEVYTPNLTVQMSFSNWVHGGRGRKLGEELANSCIVPFGDYHIECEEVATTLESDYIAFHPGSGKGQWEARNYTHWQEVITNLKRELGDIKIVQIGLEDDPLYDGCVDFRGKTENYNQLAHVVKNAKLVLGIDSVSMHLAAGLETDHISLFGSSYPTSTGPVVPLRLSKESLVGIPNTTAVVIDSTRPACTSVLMEPYTRRGCDKACYKYECKVEKDYPCINEIEPLVVYMKVFGVLDSFDKKELRDIVMNYEKYSPKVSGYTHVFNAKSGGYPFVQSITSMLGFCDEVIVVDGGSDDGTVEDVEAIGDDRIRIVERKWDWDEPGMDGMQKAFGRAMCTGEFLWQQDVDEVVHEDDYEKVRKLVKRFPKQFDLLHLPIVELWGDEKTCRTDRHSWKWRLSRNNFRISHGIVAQAREIDQETGKVYAKKGMSDGCEYVDIMSGEYIPHGGFYNTQIEQIRLQDPTQYGIIMNEVIEQLPSVWHYSWADIPRKIKNFKSFWNQCWSNLYNDKEPEDRFPDVSLDDEESLIHKSTEMRKQGGEHKLSETFQLTKKQPKIMKDWNK